MAARNTSSAACAEAADRVAKVPAMQVQIEARMADVQNRLSSQASASGVAVAGDAVMVEVRENSRNIMVLSNFRSVLPSQWVVHFWHGPTNSEAVRAAPRMASAIATGSLILRRVTVNGVPATAASFTLSNYQKLLSSVDFWSSFSRQHLLLFEADSVLCPSPSVPLSAFANTSFVGAPWSQSKQVRWAELERAFPPPQWCFNLQRCVGNSGLSLWRRDIIEQVLSRYSRAELTDAVLDYLEQPNCLHKRSECSRPKRGPYWGTPPAARNRMPLYGRQNGSLETGTTLDVWMTRILQAAYAGHLATSRGAGAHELLAARVVRAVPSEDEAALFSVETSYSGSYTPIGAHKPWHYLSVKRFDQLAHRCAPIVELHAATIRDAGGPKSKTREAGGLTRARSERDRRDDPLTHCALNVSVLVERDSSGRRRLRLAQ